MKIVYFGAIVLLWIVTSCKPPEITCDLELTNASAKKIEESWVDCGAGDIPMGVKSPGAGGRHGDFPARAGSPVNVRWRWEGDSRMHSATNVLADGVRQHREIIQLIIRDEKVEAVRKGK